MSVTGVRLQVDEDAGIAIRAERRSVHMVWTASVERADLELLLDALKAAGRGDFSVRLPREEQRGFMSSLALAFNRKAAASSRTRG